MLDAVVFDLGGVLIDWNPRYLYRKLLSDEEQIERFLREVCPPSWNAAQDAGRPWDEAVAQASADHPADAALILAYRDRWLEMVGSVHAETVQLIPELRSAGVPVYVLSNISELAWGIAVEAFDFLRDLDGVVVSGAERMIKPDQRIYRLLLDRYHLQAERTWFTDDLSANVEAARGAGLLADVYRDAAGVRRRLRELGAPVS